MIFSAYKHTCFDCCAHFERIIRKDILMSKVGHSSTAEINSIYKITIIYEKGLKQEP